GSNDGALVLPLNNCDFTEYRPLLQLGMYVTRKQLFFGPGPWDEDLFWLYGDQAISRAGEAESVEGIQETSQSSFPHGGIYLLRGADSKAILRCTDFHSRPSHADQLHLDLWWHGVNIACDAGTYLYTGRDSWRNGLAHTAVHNTVTVDGQDQMKMLTRFTWTNWSRGTVLQHDANTWRGEHDGYKRLADPVSHMRTVMSLDGDRWLVLDHLTGSQPHHYALHWLLSDLPYEPGENSILLSPEPGQCKIQVGVLDGNSSFSIVRCDPTSPRGWRSQYYADKEPAISVLLETDRPRAVFWTLFGLASDSIHLAGNTLYISSGDWNARADLGAFEQ
ncbi:MAG TPA: heparinase II/III-family protein, partial [Anaerolineales bacterium]